jgi:hypothetical protein
MKRGRWIAVAVCSGLVAIAAGLLFAALADDVSGSALRFAPYFALAMLALTPLAAGLLSGSATPFAAGAGGLAVGIAVTVVAAGLRAGGTGVMPLTLGIAVGGIVCLRADNHMEIYLRLAVTALLAVYATYSGRLVTIVFIYPLLGFADEFADAIAGRKARKNGEQREEASSVVS